MAAPAEEYIILDVPRKALLPVEIGIAGYGLDRDSYRAMPDGKSHLAGNVEGVVRNPSAIFRGADHKHYETVLCYSARPGQWIGAKGKQYAADCGHVLLVSGARDYELNRIIFWDWALLPEDRGNPGLPVNWENFGEPLWLPESP